MALDGTGSTSFTISLGGVANAAGRAPTSVSNTSGFLEAMVDVEITSDASSAPTAGGTYDIYLLRGDGEIDSIWTDDWDGTDSVFSSPLNARLLGTIVVTANTNTEFRGQFNTGDVSRSLGERWGIAVFNSSGAAIHATGANSFARYRYIKPDAAG